MTVTAKAEVKNHTRESLLGLAVGDLDALEEGMRLREAWQKKSGLDARSYAMCKIAALVSLDAPPASYVFQVATALDAGVTPDEILGVLRAITPQVGGPRVVAAAPEIMMALGLALPDGMPAATPSNGGR